MDIKEYINNRKIAIWGTDVEAVDIFYRLINENFNVEAFFDNDCKSEGVFLSKKVHKPSSEKIKQYYIFIACKYNTYFDIERQLREDYHYNVISDFLYYECFNKKLVLLHGNCHTTVMREYLEQVTEFLNEYAFYPNPTIQLNKYGYIDSEILKNCDVLLIQDIRDNNRFGVRLCEEYITSQTKESCKHIIIPNLFSLGKAFFPLTEVNFFNDNTRNGKNKNGMFPKRIVVIDELLEEGWSEQNIIKEIKRDDLIPEFQIKANFDLYMDKIKEREKAWDVKIYDFIYQNYKRHLLFYDAGHPTNFIIKEMVQQILKEFNIFAEVNDEGVSCMDMYEEWILPCVRKSLKLEFEKETIRNSSTACKMGTYMDFEEYVKQYIFYRKYSTKKVEN